MADALFWHRVQFAFTIVYHYLFPQLTMGLALLLVVMKALALYRKDSRWGDLARFWTRIFGINFVVGVVTGLPMEFQFGTNWGRFSQVTGAVIGHTLGMEGVFAFFLESALVGLLLFGDKKLGPRAHLLVAALLCLGTWMSGYFIICANAFMQHPVAYAMEASGRMRLTSFLELMANPWALAAYAHNMMASVVTASFVVCSVSALWVLRARHLPHARKALKLGLAAGLVSCVLVAFPTGDTQAKLVARYQPVALAAMEGRFESGPQAEISVIGQPNIPEKRLDNPIRIPGALSFLAYGTFHSDVKGLDAFPKEEWPTNIEVLYYAFHVMAGLGTMFIGLMGLGNLLRWRGLLERPRFRPFLWLLFFAFPFPYIATTAGWMTAELGRQPWLVFGVMRTADGSSLRVHAGSVLFTLFGFLGLYFVMGLLFVVLILREVGRGPSAPAHAKEEPAAIAPDEVAHA
jgi:cytochrome bd ubiquinol oxidase subunit I